MKILAIGAHGDDIELSSGGTLARFVQKKHQVFCLVTSSSNYTSYNGEILRTEQEAKTETINGLKTLGIKENNIILLNYPTKKVPYNNAIIEQINVYIDKIKPDLIITYCLNAESHQDHLNTVKSVLSAARYQNNIWMFEPIYPSKLSNITFKPIIYVDISSTIDLKIKALKAHVSQYKKYPHWKDLILSLARVRGIEIKTRYAEAFEPIKIEYKI